MVSYGVDRCSRYPAGRSLCPDKVWPAGRKEPSQAAVPMQAGLEDQGEATQVSGAVIAAITAAIAAMEAPSQRLVVRTIRRADRPESIWAQAGRRDLMNR